MKLFKVESEMSMYDVEADAVAEGYEQLTFVKFKNYPPINTRDYNIIAQFKDWSSWREVLNETESS